MAKGQSIILEGYSLIKDEGSLSERILISGKDNDTGSVINFSIELPLDAHDDGALEYTAETKNLIAIVKTVLTMLENTKDIGEFVGSFIRPNDKVIRKIRQAQSLSNKPKEGKSDDKSDDKGKQNL